MAVENGDETERESGTTDPYTETTESESESERGIEGTTETDQHAMSDETVSSECAVDRQ